MISPGGAVGDDQHRRAQAAGDQVAAQLEPVLVRFAHAEHHREQHPLAGFGEALGHRHALLGPLGADREVGRVEEQRHQLNAVEVAALERLEAFPELLAIWASISADGGTVRLTA